MNTASSHTKSFVNVLTILLVCNYVVEVVFYEGHAELSGTFASYLAFGCAAYVLTCIALQEWVSNRPAKHLLLGCAAVSAALSLYTSAVHYSVLLQEFSLSELYPNIGSVWDLVGIPLLTFGLLIALLSTLTWRSPE